MTVEFPALRAYLAVVDAGTFSGAAAQTGLSRMRLSRLVSGLEDSAGQALLARSESGVEPTAAGLAFDHEARELLRAYQRTLRYAASDDAVVDQVRLHAPGRLHAWARTHLLETLCSLAEGLPVVLESPADDPDAPAPGVFHLVSRPAGLGPAGEERPVGSLGVSLAASVGYTQRHGVPKTLAALAPHRVLVAADEPVWPLRGGGNLQVEPGLTLPTTGDLQAAVREGLGIGLVADLSGLVPVLPADVGRTDFLFLLAEEAWLARWPDEPAR